MPKLFKVSVQYLCNFSGKKLVMKLIFCMMMNIKVFCKLIISFFAGLGRHAQSTQTIFQYHCHISRRNILIFGINFLPMWIISFICQSKTITTIWKMKVEIGGRVKMLSYWFRDVELVSFMLMTLLIRLDLVSPIPLQCFVSDFKGIRF